MRKTKICSILAFAGMTIIHTAFSQQPPTTQTQINIPDASDATGKLHEFVIHKQLPSIYEQETLEALSHFPELKNVTVKFKIKKSFATLKTRPSFFSLLAPKGHRSYVIIISNKTIQKLMPLVFSHLGHEARIGVIGHELSHVAYLSRRTTWQCIKVFISHLSARYLDHFEYNTDLICIQHGLGKDLEAWSSYIRDTMHTRFWRGADYVNSGDSRFERYMNPSTIEKKMQAIP